MPLEPGARLGPYEIAARIGAGGMGEVYRAKDTRLDRSVAVKILFGHLASDHSAKARFEREARAVSALNHPNICTLYDVGEQDGVSFIVMELLEGETLAARLAREPLPLDQALKLASQIASALAQAHKHGVIHRDLKPGNVMLTKAGAKLLDFGLAKRGAEAAPPISSALMTRSSPLTAEGTIVGTWQYMSPEQLEGEEADARSDIFAFGAVLYEMATGRRAFAGKSQASLIAAIMGSEPAPASMVQPACPPALERLLRRCLAKSPDDRWQSASDLATELKWIAEESSGSGGAATASYPGVTPGSGGYASGPASQPASGVAAPPRSRLRPVWAAVGILLLVAAALGIAGFLRGSREAPAVVRSVLLPPPDNRFDSRYAPAVSPDGRSVAFVAADHQSVSRLWVRELATEKARVLANTEGAAYPFWSPDGKWIGFFAHEKLSKIDAAGGPVLPLCDAWDGRGGSWNPDGTILFQPKFSDPLYEVAASGGKAEPVTKLDASRLDMAHRWPYFLPDGKHYLFYVVSTTNPDTSEHSGIYVGELGSDASRMLVRNASRPAYAAGYLLYKQDTTLMAQPFDAGKAELSGDPVPVVADLSGGAYSWGGAAFGVSGSRVLVFLSGTGGLESSLTWVDLSGAKQGEVGDPGVYSDPRISHDGRKVAFGMGRDSSDLWIYDAERHVSTRFTFNPASEVTPIWSPDDTQIAFVSSRQSLGELYIKPSSGTGEEKLVFTAKKDLVLGDWSPDGRRIIFANLLPDTGFDLWTYDVGEGKAQVWLAAPYDQLSPRFFPDGKWVAYSSSESGREEIYVRSFPDPQKNRWQVSLTGGDAPVVRADGRELFFMGLDRRVMAVDVTPGPTPSFGTPHPLFEAALKSSNANSFDVAPDGERILLNALIGQNQAELFAKLFLNWTQALGR